MSLIAKFLPPPFNVIAPLIGDALLVVAAAGLLWWAVSWVSGVYHDHLALAGVTAERDQANRKYNDLTGHVTAKFDDVADKIGLLQAAIAKLEAKVAANRNGVDNNVRSAKGRLSHAPAPTAGSPDDLNDRNVLRQLLDPTVFGPAGNAGGGGARGQGAGLRAAAPHPDLVPGWKSPVPPAKPGRHAALRLPLGTDRRGNGEWRSAEVGAGRYDRRLAQGSGRAVSAAAPGRQLPRRAARDAWREEAVVMAGAGG